MPKKNPLYINGFGKCSDHVTHSVYEHYCLLTIGKEKVEPNLVPTICATLPAVNANIKDIWKDMENELLSTDFLRQAINVDILVGINTFMHCIK